MVGIGESARLWRAGARVEFNGRIVVNSPESPHEHLNIAQRHKGLHYFGPVIEPRQNIDMRLTYLQTTWWAHFQDLIPPEAMTDPSVRPKLKRETKENFWKGNWQNVHDISRGSGYRRR